MIGRFKLHKKLLGAFSKLQALLYKRFSQLHAVELLEGPHVLVLAPHPDDDVLGCGGTIKRHRQMGHTVKVVFLTDGALGISNLSAHDTANRRKMEAQHALAFLDVPTEDLYFMDQPDGGLVPNAPLIETIQSLVAGFKPQLIYLPSFLDQHADHRATNEVLKNVELNGVLISAYEVWTPLIPNRLVDITAVIQDKIRAIEAHKSQLANLDYKTAMLGLNQYRGLMYSKKKIQYAEAFICMPSADYFNLMAAVSS